VVQTIFHPPEKNFCRLRQRKKRNKKTPAAAEPKKLQADNQAPDERPSPKNQKSKRLKIK